MLSGDVYWLTHHDYTGARRTSARVAGLMIAAGQLGDLVAEGAIGVGDGVVLVTGRSADRLGAQVVRQISAEKRRYPVADWLEYLAPGIALRVGRSLAAGGEAHLRRIGLRRRPVFVATTGDTRPAGVRAALAGAVREGRPLTDHQLFLLRLARHSTIGAELLAGVGDHLTRQAYDQAEHVWPPWRDLLDTTVRAIRDRALTR